MQVRILSCPPYKNLAKATPMKKVNHFARAVSNWFGTPTAILIALLLLILWGVAGLFTGYGIQWQMVGNIAISVITFLMVFLIQNAQNHDARAMNEKMNEIVLASNEADNAFIGIEKEEIDVLEDLAKRHENV